MKRDSNDLYKVDFAMTNGEESHSECRIGYLHFKSLLSLLLCEVKI